MNYVQLTAQTAYQRGYQEQLEKLGFSFNPIKGLKNMFGGSAKPITPQPAQLAKTVSARAPQATSATQVPFAQTRLSSIPGQASAAEPKSIWGVASMPYKQPGEGKRMPGLLAEPKQQQKYQNIARKSEQYMQQYYRAKQPSLAGKPVNWNIESLEAKRPYPGDAAHIKELQDSDALKAKLEALKAKQKQKSFDPSKGSMSSLPFSWGGQTVIPNNLQTRPG